MLRPEQVRHIEQLLADGRKQREIHRLTGTARMTIRAIASGRRPHYEPCPWCGRMKREGTSCPGCTMIAQAAEREGWPVGGGEESDEPTLQLRGELLRRYEEVRRGRPLRHGAA